MKKKNGFTLIELLAILVILAIIAVITIPKINKVINESKQNAARNSAYGYKDAIEKWQTSQFEVEDIYLDGSYRVLNGKLDNYTIPITGSAPSSEYLTYEDDDLISGCLVINGYEAIYQNGKFTSTGKGDCGTPSETFIYFTYDENGEDGEYGKITEMKNQPDSSWNFYIKTGIGTLQGYTITSTSVNDYDTLEECEAEIAPSSSYTECITFNNKYKMKFYNEVYNSMQECEAEVTNVWSRFNDFEESNVSCAEINDKLKANLDFNILYNSEACGVFTGKEVCIKDNKWEEGNYIQNKKTELENAGCSCQFIGNSSLQCENELIRTEIPALGAARVYDKNNYDICAVTGSSTECYHEIQS